MKIIQFFKKSKYRIFLLGYSVLLTILLVVLFSLLWNYLSRHEELKPEKVVSEFVETTKSEYWDGLIAARYKEKVTDFEVVEKIVEKLDLNGIKPEKLSFYKRVKEYTDDSPAYTLYYKNKELAAIKLKAEESYSLGLTKWKIDKVELTLNDENANSVSVGITVPPEYEIKVNGVVLDESYITEQRVNYENVTQFETQKEGVPYRIKYKVDGLFDLPEITAFDGEGNGVELSIKSYEYSAGSNVSGSKKVKVTVPDGYNLYLNDVKVEDSYITNADAGYELLNDVAGFNGQIPVMKVYEISGLYLEPEIKVLDTEGNELPLAEEKDGNHYYDLKGSDSVKTLYQGLVEDFIRAYFKYTADGALNIGENYSKLLTYVLSGSSAYSVIQGSYNGVIWNDTHYITYNKLEFNNFKMHGNDCFSCEVEYDADFTLYIYNTHYSGKFKLVYVRQGDTFKLSKFVNE